MTDRRTFLKQLGILAIASGIELRLPDTGRPSLLTEEQRDQAVRFLGSGEMSMFAKGLPEGVRFARRAETWCGDIWGCSLSVVNNRGRVRNAVSARPEHVFENHPRVMRAMVDALVDWYDYEGWKLHV